VILVKLHITFGLALFPISNLALQIEVTQCVEDSHWFKIQTN